MPHHVKSQAQLQRPVDPPQEQSLLQHLLWSLLQVVSPGGRHVAARQKHPSPVAQAHGPLQQSAVCVQVSSSALQLVAATRQAQVVTPLCVVHPQLPEQQPPVAGAQLAPGPRQVGPAGVCEASWALAFLRHFFFALPDFFLHLAEISCAATSSDLSRDARALLSASVRARRREPEAERERVSASKRNPSIGASFTQRGQANDGMIVTSEGMRAFPQKWGCR
jgi:hypothetical protein